MKQSSFKKVFTYLYAMSHLCSCSQALESVESITSLTFVTASVNSKF